jgi:hypothetical protein
MMKKASSLEAKAAEAKRKAEVSAQLDQEAKTASERIRKQFEEERQRLARRYGGVVVLSSDDGRPG